MLSSFDGAEREWQVARCERNQNSISTSWYLSLAPCYLCAVRQSFFFIPVSREGRENRPQLRCGNVSRARSRAVSGAATANRSYFR
jgi:hypothetical protein